MLRPLALSLALLPLPATAQTLWEGQGARVQTVTYHCDSAVEELSVAYFTAADGTSFAALPIAGQVQALVQGVSGSGVIYQDINPDSGYGLHAKGDEALLLRSAPGQAEPEVLARCTAVG